MSSCEWAAPCAAWHGAAGRAVGVRRVPATAALPHPPLSSGLALEVLLSMNM